MTDQPPAANAGAQAAPPTNIAFMGTPEFAAVHLRKLLAAGFVPSLVITQPDRRAGRGRQLHAPPVKEVAEAARIEVWQPESIRKMALIDAFVARNFDVNIVVSYGQILAPRMLDAPRRGSFNIHTSLLPRWRGAAPIEWALLAGDAITGATLQRMTRGLDEGPIVAVRELKIDASDDKEKLFDRLAHLGADLLAATLPAILAGTHTETPQPSEGITIARKIEPADGHLDFAEPAAKLWGRIRACNPHPGAWAIAIDDAGHPHRLKITAATPATVADSIAVPEAASEAIPGAIVNLPGHGAAPANELAVYCGNATILKISDVQPESKKPMPIRSYLNGHRIARFAPPSSM